MRALARSTSMLVVALASQACGADVEPCTSSDQVAVGGETSAIDGVVDVVAIERDGRVSLTITPDDGRFDHTAAFALAGVDVDELVGEVTAEVGVVFAGEGSEYGYLRLTDERGVWFEGGRSPSIDGAAQGGAAIGGPFALGDEAGERCRARSFPDDYDVAVHEVVAAIGDGGAAVPVDAAGASGVWRGVDVRTVGVRADRGVYTEPANTADGLGPGPHELIEVVGYLYRIRP